MSNEVRDEAQGSGRECMVLNIQRMSTEDGPGLRTTVFLKGCSLECSWCHNPEAVSGKPQVVWHARSCIGARACDAVCEEDAILRDDDGRISINLARCTVCGDCVDQCPSAALEMVGVNWEAGALLTEVAKDESYFETSGGGITVSGGEPGLWPSFVSEFLAACHRRGFHTAVDTSGMCSAAALRTITANADLVLYDLKEIDSERHRAFTGQPNERILSNLIELAGLLRAGGPPAKLWIRTPLIPGATLREENLLGIGAFIAQHCEGIVERWELCSFNNLAGDKYQRLGLRWSFEGTQLLTPEDLRNSLEVARRSGVDPAIVVATGRTRISCDAEGEGAEAEVGGR